MKDFFSANIKRMVMLAVFLSTLPPLAILLISGLERYQDVNEAVERDGSRTVRNIADRMHLNTENTLTLLSSLRRLSTLKSFSPEATAGVFRDIVAEYPLFNNLFIFSSEGEILSSGIPVSADVSLSGTPLFGRALRNLEACAVPSAVSPFTGVPVMQYAVPMIDGHDRVYAHLGAELRLRFMDNLFAGETIPPGGVIRIMSENGMLAITSTPDSEAQPGMYVGDLLWSALREAPPGDGAVSFTNEQGEEYFAISHRLRLVGQEKPYLYVVLTIPARAAYALPDSLIRRDALLLAGAVLFAALAGLGLCYLGFTRPTRILLDVATRLGSGDLSARITGKERLRGEFAELGGEFNAMAESLEARSVELQEERAVAMRSSQAKSEFLANMSHEIRTPMNAIIGMAHLVGKTELTGQQKAMVEKVHSAADDLLQLINNILDYSKIEAGKMQAEKIPFHLGRLLSAVRAAMAGPAAARGVSLITNIPSDAPPQLMGDASHLTHALSILLGEAIRHSKAGGVVEIGCRVFAERTARSPGSEGRGRRSAWNFWNPERNAGGEAGGERFLSITLTVRGARLGPESLEDITRCFSGHGIGATRLDNTELSLMLSAAILRLLGGRAEAGNHEDGFQLSGVIRLIQPEERFDEQLLHFNGERVLLLDGNSGARNSFRTLLERCAMRVDECSDLPQALRLMQTAADNGNPFVLVITDMPPASYDAAQYLERLKNGNGEASPPLLALCAPGELKGLPPELFGSGVDAFLPRPVNESLLVDTLSGLLRGRHDEADRAAAAQGAAPEVYRFEGLRALLVDDNAVNREIAREVLENAGISVSMAINGQEAVAMCWDGGEAGLLPYDLVLMDLEMPVMDGKTASRTLRSRRNTGFWQLPIIAMTAHSGADEVAACLDAGMNDYTVKPISVAQLFAAVRRWLPPPWEDADLGRKATLDMQALHDVLVLSYARDPKINHLLEALVPFLHEGRVEALRVLVRGGNIRTAIATLDAYLTGIDERNATGRQG